MRPAKPTYAVAAIHLADDKKKLVVANHDLRVVAWRKLRCGAGRLGAALE